MRFLSDDSGRARWHSLGFAWMLVFGSVLLWGTLAQEVWKRQSLRFDVPILLWMHARSNVFLDRIMLGLSLIGGYPLLGFSAALCAFFWVRSQRHNALFVALCIGGISALNVSAKVIFQRARPDLWVSLAPEPDYSFPSGHAMLSSGVIAMLLVLLWRADSRLMPWRAIAAFSGVSFVLAVGLSRLYLGVHYPSDILAGWLASTAWVSLMRLATTKRK